MAKFTYFQYKIIWQQNNKLIMGSFKKYLTCITTFFIPLTRVTPFQFYFTTSPVLFTKNNKLWNQWKDDFLSIWLLQRITLYHTKKKIASLDPMYGINNPYWQSSECLIQYTNWSLACWSQVLSFPILCRKKICRKRQVGMSLLPYKNICDGICRVLSTIDSGL